MKWVLLKQNKCPSCGKLLQYSSDKIDNSGGVGEMFYCACGFKIHERKFTEIVNSMVNSDLSNDHPIVRDWEL